MSTVRSTVSQAVVKFLAAQHSERDGVSQRLIPGMWAIFGHGNVSGLGQALEELGGEVELPTYRPQNEQAMVHLAAAYAKHKDHCHCQFPLIEVGADDGQQGSVHLDEEALVGADLETLSPHAFQLSVEVSMPWR